MMTMMFNPTLCLPAWWGFTTSADKQRLQAFLRRGVRLNLYSALDPSVSQHYAGY